MAIDPKKIEEWNRILRDVFPLGGMVQGLRERAEAHAVQLASAASALLSEREELLALLREVEWGTEQECPACHGRPPGKGWSTEGHTQACRLAAFLR